MGSGFLNTLKDDLVALRHELHGIPELGLNLPHTQARLLRELEGLPLEITTGKDLSSITAVLRGRGAPAGERRTVLLRADMDALPVVERTGLEWASTNGNMHACGHDCHMTCLVGAVRELCERVDELAGDVVFMFQPGEEGEAGAQRMIDEGVWRLLDAGSTPPTPCTCGRAWMTPVPITVVQAPSWPPATTSPSSSKVVAGMARHPT
ncbi:M20 metallopeptidase family protein [Cutibacterium avidum]|uniref:M20 metallopeptidase family protein n=2 Tax=Cutibacterium avidum TaxID=33010 RepID=UPI0007985CA2|nr:M20/M25/M40 family metallo-hydrolase [Cutibacterium avidum]KXA68034.1 peptidase, M20/M25/M40 family [Cutibacterium avidum]MDQ9080721.1 M20/M25/M40 family metallo-hydrolase [Cutibacterium avidum]MDU5654104.1 M20/M25/M40 family metallo-hydrolase [Cutibacterium avidum]